MIQQTMDYISQFDPEVGASIREEFAREIGRASCRERV